MLSEINSDIKKILEGCGISVFEKYENADTMKYPNSIIAFFETSAEKVMPRVRSSDCSQYGVECDIKLNVCIDGRQGFYDGQSELHDAIEQALCGLCFAKNYTVTELKVSEISENRILKRLEGEISAILKVIIIKKSEVGEWQ
ncbi:MAG: hypothetical protein ACI4RC_02540 [Oscillospiraceae bacterium]